MEIPKEKLKDIVQEVLNCYNNSGEKSEEIFNRNLFITSYGKDFLVQVQNYHEFVGKGVILSFLHNFYSILPRFFDLLSTGLNSSELKQEEKDLFEFMPKVFKNPEIKDQVNNIQFFDSEDIPRFVSSLVFSIYSYSEVFVNTLVEKAFKNPLFAWQYLEYLTNKRKTLSPSFSLSDFSDYAKDPESFSRLQGISFFNQYERKNPFSRLQTLLKVLGLEGKLTGIFHELSRNDYILKFEEFKKLRDSIAHGKPEPNLSKLISEEVKDNINSSLRDIQKEIKIESSSKFKDEAIPEIEQIFTEIQNSFTPIIPPISIIRELLVNVTVLPAILERIITRFISQGIN